MSILFASGFETGDLAEWTGPAGNVTVQSSIKHTGNHALRIQEWGTTGYAGGSLNKYRLSFWFYAAVLPLEGDEWVVFVDNTDAVANKVGACINSNGQMGLRNVSGDMLTHYDSTFSISIGQWYRICITTDSVQPSAYSKIRLYVDGRLVSWDDDAGAQWVATKLGVPSPGSAPIDFYYDDVVYDDDDTSLANMEDMRVLRAGIIGAGEYAEFDSYVGSANHFENVDELSPNEDDYNYDAVNNPAKESYALEDSAAIGLIERNVIKAVGTWVRMKRGGGGGTIFNFLRRDNGVDVEDVVAGVDTSWRSFWHFDEEMPNGGGRWVQNRFDAFEIGISYNGGARDPYFSFAVAMIVFSPYLFVRSIATIIGGASADLTFVTEEKKAAPALVFGASGSGVNSWDF